MAGESRYVAGMKKINRHAYGYKERTWKIDQESRRNVLLERQKRRREESFNAFRDFYDVFNANEESHHYEYNDAAGDDTVDENVEKESFPKLKDLFMHSEWMTELPVDFEDKWLLMPCPVGKRCLVRSCKGYTTVFGKMGYELARFKSSLPNGGYYNNSSNNMRSGVTVLDCIWDVTTRNYFIIDILYWKSQSYLDTDVGFRSFWIKSKIEEMPWLMEKSKKNPFPFVPLECYGCDITSISSVMSAHPYFKFDKPKVDGLLFFHKDGYYTPGLTPLVLWLKPFMLVEILGQDAFVAEEYFRELPCTYTNMLDYISDYEETRMRKKKKKKKKAKKGKKGKSLPGCEGMDVSSSDAQDMEIA